jgi:hypothetical protein
LAGYARFRFQEVKVDAVDGAHEAERGLYPAKVSVAAARNPVGTKKEHKGEENGQCKPAKEEFRPGAQRAKESNDCLQIVFFQ